MSPPGLTSGLLLYFSGFASRHRRCRHSVANSPIPVGPQLWFVHHTFFRPRALRLSALDERRHSPSRRGVEDVDVGSAVSLTPVPSRGALVKHRGISCSELVILEEVGHVPMVEKPGETARHHLAFLAKH